jgi:hypothetical protein
LLAQFQHPAIDGYLQDELISSIVDMVMLKQSYKLTNQLINQSTNSVVILSM